MRWRRSVILAVVVLVPALRRYWRSGRSSSSSIQMIWAANWSVVCGTASTQARMSPRVISSSSARTSVTDRPADTSARSPSKVTMRATVEVRAEGATAILIPGRTAPETTRPQ